MAPKPCSLYKCALFVLEILDRKNTIAKFVPATNAFKILCYIIRVATRPPPDATGQINNVIPPTAIVIRVMYSYL